MSQHINIIAKQFKSNDMKTKKKNLESLFLDKLF